MEDAKKEDENLPDLVILILLCRLGINNALQINPTAANAMGEKIARMLYALENEDMPEVNELLQQLLPEAKKYSNQVPDNNFKVLMGASISQASFSIQDELNFSDPLPLVQYNSMSNNPYDILEVSPVASDDEIHEAYKLIKKQKKYSSSVLANARKKLLESDERLVADYLLPDLPPIRRFKRYELSGLEKPEPKLKLIEEIEKEGLDEFYAKVMEDFNENTSSLF